MPPTIETVHVRAVHVAQTRKPDVQRYTIQLQRTPTAEQPWPWVSVVTLNAWMASLCQQAQERKQAVVVARRPSRFFDDELVSVRLSKKVA
jgi:hypothetical protein